MGLWDWLFGRPPVKSTSTGPAWRVDIGSATYAERGEVVGKDFEDEFRDTKVADNVGAPLSFTYATPGSEPRQRGLIIDGVYGPSIDAPSYIRGLDARSRDARTFRVDRIQSISRGDGSLITEDIGWWIGAMAREAAGLPLVRQPCRWEIRAGVEISVEYDSGRLDRFQGQITDARLIYRAAPVVIAAFEGRLKHGGRSRRFEVEIGPDAQRRRVSEIVDMETGEVVEDLAAWLDDRAQRPPSDSDDSLNQS